MTSTEGHSATAKPGFRASQPAILAKHPPRLLPSRVNSAPGSSQVHSPQGLTQPIVMLCLVQLTAPKPTLTRVTCIWDTPEKVSACGNQWTDDS